jgi:hypothetical protein
VIFYVIVENNKEFGGEKYTRRIEIMHALLLQMMKNFNITIYCRDYI